MKSESKDVSGITSDFVKKVAPSIIVPLTQCINDCLANGIFPALLKPAEVVPIYKKGYRQSPGNYRPISVVRFFFFFKNT